jgi:ABC-type transport system substrate-binding protein
MRRAMVEADDNRRLQLWGDVQEAVVKDVPMIFLMHEEQFVLFKPYVQGVKVTANDSTALPGKDSLKEVWLAER